MGFASEGCFHIRLEFAEGMAPALYEPDDTSMFNADLMTEEDGNNFKYYVRQERLVEDSVDILVPLVKAEDLKEVQSRQARIGGYYTRSGVEIEGVRPKQDVKKVTKKPKPIGFGPLNGRGRRNRTLGTRFWS